LDKFFEFHEALKIDANKLIYLLNVEDIQHSLLELGLTSTKTSVDRSGIDIKGIN
jgi:hypothetical protein